MFSQSRSAVGSGTSGSIMAMTIHNSELYVGGGFSTIGGMIYLYNSLVENVYSEIVSSEKFRIDLSNRAEGLYFYTIIKNNELTVRGNLNIIR